MQRPQLRQVPTQELLLPACSGLVPDTLCLRTLAGGRSCLVLQAMCSGVAGTSAGTLKGRLYALCPSVAVKLMYTLKKPGKQRSPGCYFLPPPYLPLGGPQLPAPQRGNGRPCYSGPGTSSAC